MEWICKGTLTAVIVWLVMRLADRFGPRVGGVTAALPMVTAPTLLWVAHEQGLRFAAGAAVGSVAACAVLASFALAYALISRRRGSAVALAAGIAAVAVTALPALALSSSLPLSLVGAIATAMVASAVIQRHAVPASASRLPSRLPSPRAAPVVRPGPDEWWRLCVAAIVGATTALVAAVGPALGDCATGLLASLPLIGGTIAVLEQLRGGSHAVAEFLRGYVAGLFARAAFGATFALATPSVGAVLGLALAVTAAATVSAALRQAALGSVRRAWIWRAP